LPLLNLITIHPEYAQDEDGKKEYIIKSPKKYLINVEDLQYITVTVYITYLLENGGGVYSFEQTASYHTIPYLVFL